MKVIVNRFRIVFPKIIMEEQARFIVGRNITSNIVIVQEVIHSMKGRKNKKAWMVIKIDLEKAYDRVRWELIDASFKVVGISGFSKNAIMSVISNSTMHILWMGSQHKSLSLKKGFVRGVICPHICLCCVWSGLDMNYLVISNGQWCPIKLSRSSLNLSHLFFC